MGLNKLINGVPISTPHFPFLKIFCLGRLDLHEGNNGYGCVDPAVEAFYCKEDGGNNL